MAKKEKPDLIICDIMMPELDGYSVLHILSKDQQTSGIPFIFLSAKAEIRDMRKGMNMGADDYLTKPFEETELLNAIETRLKRNESFRKSFSPDMKGLVEFVNEAKQFSLPQSIIADHKVRSYQKKETLYHEGDMPNMVYFMNKGKVKTWKMSSEGKEFITGIYDKGEFFGHVSILEGSEHTDSATTLEDAEIVFIPKPDFLALVYSNPDVSACFVKMLANNISEQEERLLGLAYNSVRARVAGALLLLQKKYKDNKNIRISRDDLASVVGTSTESLIRTLSDFKEEKMIETDAREIKILNPGGLEKIKKFS